MMESRFTCRYCGGSFAPAERTDEHVMPAALGGTWTIQDVCGSCQTYTDRYVDRPFVRALPILEARNHYRIPDRYGAIPPAVRLIGRIEQDGSPAAVTLDRADPQFRMLPVEEWLDKNTIRFGAEAAEYSKHKNLKLARLRKQHNSVEDLGEEAHVIERPYVVCDHESDKRMKLPADLWARFVAKVALAVGPEEMGETWLQSEAASYLRALLRGQRPAPLAGFEPPHKQPSALWEGPLGRYYRPPEHVIWPRQNGEAAWIHVVLFGELSYGLPLGHVVLPGNPTVRRFDPVARRFEALTESLWFAHVAERFDRRRGAFFPPPLSPAQ
jgi:hypothetical protein